MTATSGNIQADAELFRVLGHETRLRLLMLLAEGEHGVGEIDTISGIGQPGLSQQLAILRKARLVMTRRVAKQVYYRVDPAAVEKAADLLALLSRPETGLMPQRQDAAAPSRTSASAARFARIV